MGIFLAHDKRAGTHMPPFLLSNQIASKIVYDIDMKMTAKNVISGMVGTYYTDSTSIQIQCGHRNFDMLYPVKVTILRVTRYGIFGGCPTD